MDRSELRNLLKGGHTQIGKGKFGSVYKVKDKPIVFKNIMVNNQREFSNAINEIEALTVVNGCPHVVTYYGWTGWTQTNRTKDNYGKKMISIFMEYVEGYSLSELRESMTKDKKTFN